MTKKKIAGTKNVYELAQERLKVIFNEFDNIYVSFSGGKDSGVLLNMCIDYIRKNNLKVRLGVFHMDYEIQYKMTIDYVDRMLEANKDILDVYRVCIPFRVATCTSMYQSFLASVGRQQKEYMGSFHAEKGNDQRRFSFL
jgi:Predicted phosphoadenosine phosphosulfate sulfotransferase